MCAECIQSGLAQFIHALSRCPVVAFASDLKAHAAFRKFTFLRNLIILLVSGPDIGIAIQADELCISLRGR